MAPRPERSACPERSRGKEPLPVPLPGTSLVGVVAGAEVPPCGRDEGALTPAP